MKIENYKRARLVGGVLCVAVFFALIFQLTHLTKMFGLEQQDSGYALKIQEFKKVANKTASQNILTIEKPEDEELSIVLKGAKFSKEDILSEVKADKKQFVKLVDKTRKNESEKTIEVKSSKEKLEIPFEILANSGADKVKVEVKRGKKVLASAEKEVIVQSAQAKTVALKSEILNSAPKALSSTNITTFANTKALPPGVGVGITPNAINLPTPTNPVGVTNWGQFVAAYNNQSVDAIIVMNDITDCPTGATTGLNTVARTNTLQIRSNDPKQKRKIVINDRYFQPTYRRGFLLGAFSYQGPNNTRTLFLQNLDIRTDNGYNPRYRALIRAESDTTDISGWQIHLDNFDYTLSADNTNLPQERLIGGQENSINGSNPTLEPWVVGITGDCNFANNSQNSFLIRTYELGINTASSVSPNPTISNISYKNGNNDRSNFVQATASAGVYNTNITIDGNQTGSFLAAAGGVQVENATIWQNRPYSYNGTQYYYQSTIFYGGTLSLSANDDNGLSGMAILRNVTLKSIATEIPMRTPRSAIAKGKGVYVDKFTSDNKNINLGYSGALFVSSEYISIWDSSLTATGSTNGSPFEVGAGQDFETSNVYMNFDTVTVPVVKSTDGNGSTQVGKVLLTDKTMLNFKATATQGERRTYAFKSKEFELSGESKIAAEFTTTQNSNAEGNGFWEYNSGGYKFTVSEKSKVDLTLGSYGRAISVQYNQASPTYYPANSGNLVGEINIKGDPTLATTQNNTQFNVHSSNPVDQYYSGSIRIWNKPDAMALTTFSGTVNFSVSDYAEMNMDNTSSTNGNTNNHIVFQSLNGNLYVDNHAKLNIRSQGGNGGWTAAIRYRFSGRSLLNVKNGGMLSVVQTGTGAPAVRMNGHENEMKIENGGKFYVENEGIGNPANGNVDSGTTWGSTAGHQAIVFLGNPETAGLNPSRFTLIGAGSMVKLVAGKGTALDSGGTIEVTQGQGTEFEAIGNTAGNSILESGIFRSDSGAFRFTMNRPRYYNFENKTASTDAGSHHIFSSHNATAQSNNTYFKSLNSFVSIWKKGNVGGTADYNFYDQSMNYQLNTHNYIADDPTQTPDATIRTLFGPTAPAGATPYRRLSANNNEAEPVWLAQPTDADKFIHIKSQVREASDANGNPVYRPAMTGEVHAKVQVQYPAGSGYTDAVLLGHSVDSGNMYGTTVGGLIKIPVGHFLPAGTQIKILEMWRSDSTSTSSAGNLATDPAKLLAIGTKEVKDVRTPQTPNNVEGQKGTTNGELTNASDRIVGKAEPNSIIALKVNGSWLMKKSVANTVLTSTTDGNGDFSFQLEDYLTDGDVVDVYSKDISDLSGGDWSLFAPPTSNKSEPNNLAGNLVLDVGSTDAQREYHDAVGADKFGVAVRLNVKNVRATQATIVKSMKIYRNGAEVTTAQIGDTVRYKLEAKNTSTTGLMYEPYILDNISPHLSVNLSELDAKLNGATLPNTSITWNTTSRDLTLRGFENQTWASNTSAIWEFSVKVASSGINQNIDNQGSFKYGTERWANGPSLIGQTGLTREILSHLSNIVSTPKVFGALEITEAPKLMDFGKKTVSTVNETYTLPQYKKQDLTTDAEFIVSDSRATKDAWRVTAKLTTPFTHEQNPAQYMHDILYYQKGAGNTPQLITSAGTEIYTNPAYTGSSPTVTTQISTGWRTPTAQKGFMMKVDPNKVKLLGDYKAEITYTLEAAP
ncbi:hypothetical protein SAMN02745116_02084 [Pilibacter termitis]|uniref:Uncharacterized protein n=1 Tax=Pilibacter termitis TaxID=263852 RepID=A0A1T4Q6R7_9ENTE|nr:pectate lyase-like adhesive domain-containing protein [Pilibacter termitis]SJZ99473.1 hypothetical protein SAMN02745116_02084 [Pilibacter termitis]